jgi:hypothetical protein
MRQIEAPFKNVIKQTNWQGLFGQIKRSGNQSNGINFRVIKKLKKKCLASIELTLGFSWNLLASPCKWTQLRYCSLLTGLGIYLLLV